MGGFGGQNRGRIGAILTLTNLFLLLDNSVCPSVRLSVCLSVKRVRDKTEEKSVVIFSERELKFMFAICRRPSVCRLSVCL